MNATKRILTIRLLAAMAIPAFAQVPEEGGVALTVYNGGYAVVREVRSLSIDADGEVRFRDVPTNIDPTTVHFKSFTQPGAKLLEQNYQYDLVSASKLLQKYIDRDIEVFTEDKRYAGTLLSFDGAQLVLQDADGGIMMIQRHENVRDIRFGKLPEGLLTQPTLLWLVDAKAGEHMAEVTYQTGGMSWHAEYVLVLNGDDSAADLSGWVSVENNSGKIYKDAKLKFIAGDVRRVQEQLKGYSQTLREEESGRQAGMQEKAFFEYHMYTLGRPSTVANNEVKQLELFDPARGVKIEKKYLYNPLGSWRWNWGGRYDSQTYGTENVSKKVAVFIEFKNEEANKLGIPLPAGKVRVYKQDPDDEAMEFVGEERIDHTPKNEELRLQIGNAFDIVGERKQTNFQRRGNWIEEKIEIRIRNHKKEDVVVRIKEPMYRWVNWKITEKNTDFEKLDARNIAFDVPVKADGETVVTYTVEYDW